MDTQRLVQLAEHFVCNSPKNFVSASYAITPELVGTRLFNPPILGFAAADDTIFFDYKKPDIIGSHFLLPTEWMPNCKTVISFFLPFSSEVIKSNSEHPELPSNLWLHGRVEGDEFLHEFIKYMMEQLANAGMETVAPVLSDDYKVKSVDNSPVFTSRWSERHVAFAAGLGTFGLSKGIITEKGMAGRFTSLLTDGVFQPTKRKYTDVYEYCNNCGACVRNCPAKAISKENGKDDMPCHLFLQQSRKQFSPRYGCGKCQVNVPCSYRIPNSKE